MADEKTTPEVDETAEPLTLEMADEEIVAADGHVVLSKEDIKARKAADKAAAKS